MSSYKNSKAFSVYSSSALLGNYHNAHLPTVITSTMRGESFALSYPNLWNKLLDPTMSQILVIDMPPYRRVAKAGKSALHKKK